MNLEARMNDVRFRLLRLREDQIARKLEAWKVEELARDCAALRADDAHGEYAKTLAFIEEMLGYILRNLRGVARLEELRRELGQLAG